MLLIWVSGQWQRLPWHIIRQLLLCAALLSINWLTFIYGIQAGKIAETSLGYFINPLLTVLLAAWILNEAMSPLQWLATGVASLGVGLELLSVGYFPWIALSLAVSFSLYGLLRRRLMLPAALGLGIETTLLLPFALVYLLVLSDTWHRSGDEVSLLALGGVVTIVPLLCFGAAARRLPLTILGYFQFLAPTISLLLAVFYYEEVVSSGRWVSFTLVWAALAVFLFDVGRRRTA